MTSQTRTSGNSATQPALAQFDPYTGCNPVALLVELTLGAVRLKNGRPNPLYVAIATCGYKFQLTVLRIPDRFCAFSPGPPALQALQGFVFTMVTGLPSILSMPSFMSSASYTDSTAGGGTKMALAGILAIGFAGVWAFSVLDSRRRAEYDWQRRNVETTRQEERVAPAWFRLVLGLVWCYVMAGLLPNCTGHLLGFIGVKKT